MNSLAGVLESELAVIPDPLMRSMFVNCCMAATSRHQSDGHLRVAVLVEYEAIHQLIGDQPLWLGKGEARE